MDVWGPWTFKPQQQAGSLTRCDKHRRKRLAEATRLNRLPRQRGLLREAFGAPRCRTVYPDDGRAALLCCHPCSVTVVVHPTLVGAASSCLLLASLTTKSTDGYIHGGLQRLDAAAAATRLNWLLLQRGLLPHGLALDGNSDRDEHRREAQRRHGRRATHAVV